MDYNLDAIRNNPLYKLIKLELKKETSEIPQNIIDALIASSNPSSINPFLTLTDINLAFEFDAFITQTSTNTPELIVRRNTYGEYTVEYVTIGTYNIVFNNTVLTDNLTFPNSTPIVNIDASGNIFSYSRIDNKTIQITSSNSDSELTNGLLDTFHIYFNTTI